MKIPERVYLRIVSHADRDESTGCLVSRYSVGSHGYAQVGWNEGGKRTVTVAHRALWIYVNGDPGDGVTVDHGKCRNRKCVEIAHLRLLTNLDNARRTDGRDWPIGQCAQGHDDSWWLPKAHNRQKGYCSGCKITRRRKAQGRVCETDFFQPRELAL